MCLDVLLHALGFSEPDITASPPPFLSPSQRGWGRAKPLKAGSSGVSCTVRAMAALAGQSQSPNPLDLAELSAKQILGSTGNNQLP